MEFWEYIYSITIIWCLPLLWLALTLVPGHNTFNHQPPKWSLMICCLGILQIVFLGTTHGAALLIPFWLLIISGAPTSAIVIGTLAMLLSYMAVAFAMVSRDSNFSRNK